MLGRTLSGGLSHLSSHIIATAPTAAAGLALASMTAYDAILIDLVLPDASGLDVLGALASTPSASSKKLMFTGYAALDSAVAAMRLGASDYLEKPVDPEEILTR